MIIRSARKQSNFTVLPNEALRDTRLSFKARGLLAFILSMPDNWCTSSTALARMGKDGRDSVRAGLRELRNLGYVQLQKRQTPAGQWVTDVVVYEHPVNPVDNEVDNFAPRPEKPTSENPALIQELTNKGFKYSDNFKYAQPEVCGECNGSRYNPDTWGRCQYCNGAGLITNGH